MCSENLQIKSLQDEIYYTKIENSKLRSEIDRLVKRIDQLEALSQQFMDPVDLKNWLDLINLNLNRLLANDPDNIEVLSAKLEVLKIKKNVEVHIEKAEKEPLTVMKTAPSEQQLMERWEKLISRSDGVVQAAEIEHFAEMAGKASTSNGHNCID